MLKDPINWYLMLDDYQAFLNNWYEERIKLITKEYQQGLEGRKIEELSEYLDKVKMAKQRQINSITLIATNPTKLNEHKKAMEDNKKRNMEILGKCGIKTE